MTRTVQDAALGSPTSRARLAPGRRHWRTVEAGALHIGYRKGPTQGQGGSWMSRTYLGGSRYEVRTIGLADDVAPADGTKILSFAQAQRMAVERFRLDAKQARAKADP